MLLHMEMMELQRDIINLLFQVQILFQNYKLVKMEHN